MIELFLTGVLWGTAANGLKVVCFGDDSTSDSHLMNLCGPLIAESPAYSVTYQASLSPQPASQQIVVYYRDGGWIMNVAGYGWKPGREVVTRRQEIAISDVDAQMLSERLTESSMKKLTALPYYGSAKAICTDGASYEVAAAIGGKKLVASQHSCAGKTELNEVTSAFRDLALKYEPAFNGLLSGFED